MTAVYITNLEAWCKIIFKDNPLLYAHHLYLNGEEIKDLVIPNSLTSIGVNIFSGCSGLTSVTIPNNVTSIGEGVFRYCSGLMSVTIPNSVTSIGSSAFLGCSGLTTVTIPNSVSTIGSNTFWGCSGLTSVNIPNSVKSIEGYAFYNCSGLSSITIPNSVTSIGNWTFNGCNGLTSVTIGSGIKTIGSQAFASCKELTDVYCHAENVPNTQSNAFQNSYTEYATLHVPTALVNAYRQAEPWKNFKEVVSLGGDTPEPPVTPQCATPTISYQNGELSFGCTTEGVEFISEITDTDIKKYYANKVQLTATYNISVYATKTGYDNSDVATATLCWIDKEPVIDVTAVSQVPAQAILIQSEGGVMTVQGLDDGQQVRVYGINGTEAGAAVSSNGQATINTNLQPGSVVIIKIGDRSVKVAIK